MDPTQRFLNACRRLPVDRPPVWLMRQAGRYQPSYRALKEKVSFLDICRTPELACQVAVATVDEIGVDAAILFSDILVPVEHMGVTVEFAPGPVISPAIRDEADIARLRTEGVADEMGYVYDAVRATVAELDGRVPLLGFAGAPLTLASYLIEGTTSRNHHELKRIMYGAPDVLHRLLDKLATVVAGFLRRQIEAGCVAVQLFDTWAGIMDIDQWRRFSQPYASRVMQELAGTGAPVIFYARNAAHLHPALAELPCDVLSVDWLVSLGEVRQQTGGRYALQGNLDPGILRAPHEVIREGVRATLESYGRLPGHIFNLGHGITPDATVDAARALVAAVKELGPDYGGDPA